MKSTASYPIFSYPLQIREFHLDTFGHVNNATYLSLFEEARWQLITDNGYGLGYIQKCAQGPVILEVNLKFLRELRLRQSIKIMTQIVSYQGKIMQLKQWMEDDQGQTCAEALFVAGLFDLKSRKLILPTAEWLRAVGMPDGLNA